jgi:hypothetical protein
MTSIALLPSGGCDRRRDGSRRLHFVQPHLVEEGMPNRVTTGVVDDLPTDPRAAVQDHRCCQVRREVLEGLAGTNNAEDVRVARTR